MNCGICTAICSASEFYNYHPRIIVDTVQSKDDDKIEELLKSETHLVLWRMYVVQNPLSTWKCTGIGYYGTTIIIAGFGIFC